MQLAPLSSDLEARFWDIVNQDRIDDYFFIYDWTLQKSRTQIYFAMDADAVAGFMLIYDGHIVQLRGDTKAVGFLLSNLNLQQGDVQVPAACESLLLEKYPKFALKENVILMNIKRGQEQPNITMVPQLLSVTDAAAVAELMYACYPEMWGEVSAENVEVSMAAKEAIWRGIKVEGQLAAFGYATRTPKVSHVTWIATASKFQRRGFSTSIVSSLIKECLVTSEEAIIYVTKGNEVAKHIYQKVGFNPYTSYVFLKY